MCLALFANPVFADKLGQIKVFSAHPGDGEISITMLELGEKQQRMALVAFHAPGYSIDQQHNVYQGECETTKCNKIVYKIVGGRGNHLLSHSGYFGDYYSVLLKERPEPLAVYYDKTKSKTVSKERVYADYLKHVGRGGNGSNADAGMTLLEQSLTQLRKQCGATAKLIVDKPAFQQAEKSYLIGLGVGFAAEIALRCKDEDYRSEFSKIKEFHLGLTEQAYQISFEEGVMRVGVSAQSYNPRYITRAWLDQL